MGQFTKDVIGRCLTHKSRCLISQLQVIVVGSFLYIVCMSVQSACICNLVLDRWPSLAMCDCSY